MDPGGSTWEWILIIEAPKWMMQTLAAKKVDEKDGVICMVSMFLSWVIRPLNL